MTKTSPSKRSFPPPTILIAFLRNTTSRSFPFNDAKFDRHFPSCGRSGTVPGTTAAIPRWAHSEVDHEIYRSSTPLAKALKANRLWYGSRFIQDSQADECHNWCFKCFPWSTVHRFQATTSDQCARPHCKGRCRVSTKASESSKDLID